MPVAEAVNIHEGTPINLKYTFFGPDDPSLPVVVICGGLGSQMIHACYNTVVSPLLMANYRVLRIENRDSGQSVCLSNYPPKTSVISSTIKNKLTPQPHSRHPLLFNNSFVKEALKRINNGENNRNIARNNPKNDQNKHMGSSNTNIFSAMLDEQQNYTNYHRLLQNTQSNSNQDHHNVIATPAIPLGPDFDVYSGIRPRQIYYESWLIDNYPKFGPLLDKNGDIMNKYKQKLQNSLPSTTTPDDANLSTLHVEHACIHHAKESKHHLNTPHTPIPTLSHDLITVNPLQYHRAPLKDLFYAHFYHKYSSLLTRDIPEPSYDLIDIACDIILLINSLKIDKFHVLGISMGGFTALLLSSLIPNRVLSYIGVMTSTQHPKYNPSTMFFLKSMIFNKKSFSAPQPAYPSSMVVLYLAGLLNKKYPLTNAAGHAIINRFPAISCHEKIQKAMEINGKEPRVNLTQNDINIHQIMESACINESVIPKEDGLLISNTQNNDIEKNNSEELKEKQHQLSPTLKEYQQYLTIFNQQRHMFNLYIYSIVEANNFIGERHYDFATKRYKSYNNGHFVLPHVSRWTQRSAGGRGIERQVEAILSAPARDSLLFFVSQHIPCLFIHGDADSLQPCANSYHSFDIVQAPLLYQNSSKNNNNTLQQKQQTLAKNNITVQTEVISSKQNSVDDCNVDLNIEERCNEGLSSDTAEYIISPSNNENSNQNTSNTHQIDLKNPRLGFYQRAMSPTTSIQCFNNFFIKKVYNLSDIHLNSNATPALPPQSFFNSLNQNNPSARPLERYSFFSQKIKGEINTQDDEKSIKKSKECSESNTTGKSPNKATVTRVYGYNPYTNKLLCHRLCIISGSKHEMDDKFNQFALPQVLLHLDSANFIDSTLKPLLFTSPTTVLSSFDHNPTSSTLTTTLTEEFIQTNKFSPNSLYQPRCIDSQQITMFLNQLANLHHIDNRHNLSNPSISAPSTEFLHGKDNETKTPNNGENIQTDDGVNVIDEIIPYIFNDTQDLLYGLDQEETHDVSTFCKLLLTNCPQNENIHAQSDISNISPRNIQNSDELPLKILKNLGGPKYTLYYDYLSPPTLLPVPKGYSLEPISFQEYDIEYYKQIEERLPSLGSKKQPKNIQNTKDDKITITATTHSELNPTSTMTSSIDEFILEDNNTNGNLDDYTVNLTDDCYDELHAFYAQKMKQIEKKKMQRENNSQNTHPSKKKIYLPVVEGCCYRLVPISPSDDPLSLQPFENNTTNPLIQNVQQTFKEKEESFDNHSDSDLSFYIISTDEVYDDGNALENDYKQPQPPEKQQQQPPQPQQDEIHNTQRSPAQSILSLFRKRNISSASTQQQQLTNKISDQSYEDDMNTNNGYYPTPAKQPTYDDSFY